MVAILGVFYHMGCSLWSRMEQVSLICFVNPLWQVFQACLTLAKSSDVSSEVNISFSIGHKAVECGGSKEVKFFKDLFSETTQPKDLKIVVDHAHGI